MIPLDTSLILLLIAVLMTIIVILATAIGYGADQSNEDEPGLIKRFVEFCRNWFPVLFIVSGIRLFLYEPFLIPSESMEPGLMPGDYILVDKLGYGLNIPFVGKYFSSSPERGDVIVFVGPNKKQNIIKRVIGLPGDEVSYFRGKVFVNGDVIKTDAQESSNQKHLFIREYYSNTIAITKVILTGKGKGVYPGPQGKWDVLPGTYFVMGDHRNRSRDSRMYGVIQEDAIVGQAVSIWMSWNRMLPDFHRVGTIR
jgi:signal peptidase I